MGKARWYRPFPAWRPTWKQFERAWRALLASVILLYGVVVTAEKAPGALPYVLASGLGLFGLTISVPKELKRKDEDE